MISPKDLPPTHVNSLSVTKSFSLAGFSFEKPVKKEVKSFIDGTLPQTKAVKVGRINI